MQVQQQQQPGEVPQEPQQQPGEQKEEQEENERGEVEEQNHEQTQLEGATTPIPCTDTSSDHSKYQQLIVIIIILFITATLVVSTGILENMAFAGLIYLLSLSHHQYHYDCSVFLTLSLQSLHFES